MFLKILYSFLFSFVLITETAFSEATLNAPSEVNAGAEFEVKWTGPNNDKDFITIVEKSAEENRFGKYVYTKKGNPTTLTAPDDKGNYELRYIDNEARETLARRSIKVLKTSATLEAPPEATAGSEIKVSWQGPDGKGDFITIVKEGSDEKSYGKYAYVKKGNPIRLRVPDDAGNYEIRYLSGQKYYTLGSTPIKIIATSASLDVPPDAKAGSEIEVKWEGPGNEQDFITIVEADAEEKSYDNYVYLTRSKENRDGKKYVKIRVPEKAGSYEIRYLTGQSRNTLTRQVLTVTSTEATLEAPSEAAAGSEFEVVWTGPDNKQDFITIVEAEAEEKSYDNYSYLTSSKENRDGKAYIKLTAPDKTGNYEIRYLTGQSRITLERRPITVTDVSATLEAPSEVVAGDKFKVSWTGPDNKSDYIAIFDAGAEDAKYISYAYTRRGNPVKIQAPNTPGLHEIRYLTGQSKKSLASIEINVIKSKVPGTLKVISANKEGSASPSAIGAVELILDASGSMLQKLNGKRRINIAKDAVTNLVKNSLEPGTPFAMRVFGHKEADSCRTDLEISLKPLVKNSAISNISSINAKNLAKTPIAKSLSLVSEDLAGIEGKAIIVLVTDGEETCEGDPKQAIQSLKDAGYDIRVNIVGFAIDELALKETFREWANVGNGSYFDAGNAEELGKSIQKAIEIPFEVMNAENEVVATGVLNGDAVSVPAGNYSVKVLSGKTKTIENVAVEPEKEKVVNIE